MSGTGGSSPMPTTALRRATPAGIWIAALVVLAAGILFQGVRALATGWVPAADDGYWALMARSVFSAHPPLLGSSSSGGLTTGTGFHHLGPLGFYLLAPFVAVLGGVGVAFGASVLNAVAAVLAPVAVRSAVGVRAGWFVAVGSAALAFVMGSELLVDPWNPYLATLPFWLGLCCTWAVLRGGIWWAALGLVALSLSIQTHLSFVPLGAVAALVTVVALLWWSLRRTPPPSGTTDPDHADRGEGPLRRWVRWRWAPAALAAAVTLLANLPVLIEQFLGAGPGNLGQVLEGSGDQGPTIGLAVGVRLVAQPLLQVWNWLPGSWEEHVIAGEAFGSPWILVVAVAVLMALLVVALRRRAVEVAVPLGVATLLLLVGTVVAATLPFRFFGAPMSLARWVWPLALFVQVLALDAAVELLARGGGTAPDTSSGAGAGIDRRVGPGVLPAAAGCVVVVALVVANLVPRDEGSGAVVAQHPAISEALEQAAPELDGVEHAMVPLPIDPIGNNAAVALMDWLDERGTDFSIDDPVALRQAGRHHAPDGTETHTVLVRGGASVLDPSPEGYDTIAEVNPLSESEVEWYLATRDLVRERLPEFERRVAEDPVFRAAVGMPRVVEPDQVGGWGARLCNGLIVLPTGNETTEAELIDDESRLRLCRLDAALLDGAVAIHLGPPPGE